jgi:hypothetical protein
MVPARRSGEGGKSGSIESRAYTPAAVNDGFSWWLVVLGIAVGIGLVWLFTVRLPVNESDVDAEETVEEAGWISETIESWGGVAPAPLVQEVLELHKRYLAGDRSMTEPDADAPETPIDAVADESEAPAATVPAGAVPGGDLPPGAVSQASYTPPAYPPAGGFAEIPPPPLPRAEPE